MSVYFGEASSSEGKQQQLSLFVKIVQKLPVLSIYFFYKTNDHNKRQQHDNTNNVAYVPSKDSNQPGHPSSLVRVFAVRLRDSLGCKLPPFRQRRFSSYAEPSLGKHAPLLAGSCRGSTITSQPPSSVVISQYTSNPLRVPTGVT